MISYILTLLILAVIAMTGCSKEVPLDVVAGKGGVNVRVEVVEETTVHTSTEVQEEVAIEESGRAPCEPGELSEQQEQEVLNWFNEEIYNTVLCITTDVRNTGDVMSAFQLHVSADGVYTYKDGVYTFTADSVFICGIEGKADVTYDTSTGVWGYVYVTDQYKTVDGEDVKATYVKTDRISTIEHPE